jgi:hypothetical protein
MLVKPLPVAAVLTAPWVDLSCMVEGALQMTLAYGAASGVIGATMTLPDVSMLMVAVSTTPFDAPLMVHDDKTVAEI